MKENYYGKERRGSFSLNQGFYGANIVQTISHNSQNN